MGNLIEKYFGNVLPDDGHVLRYFERPRNRIGTVQAKKVDSGPEQSFAVDDDNRDRIEVVVYSFVYKIGVPLG